MANKINGDILFPNFDLLTWKVGSYGGFLDNKKVGDVAAHIKFPVILTDKDVKWAAENGCRYVTDLKKLIVMVVYIPTPDLSTQLTNHTDPE